MCICNSKRKNSKKMPYKMKLYTVVKEIVLALAFCKINERVEIDVNVLCSETSTVG